MILSDGEIRRAIVNGDLIFEPVLEDDYLDVALTTSAIDLRLGAELQIYKSLEVVRELLPLSLANEIVIDPSKRGTIPDLIAKWAEKVSIHDSHYDLQPGKFILGATSEKVSMPESGCLAARVEGKSTLARLGFQVHMTAPTIHCGFSGSIVLEMYNLGNYPIRLSPGMRVCQLIFERLGEPPLSAQSSQYQGQAGASSIGKTE